MLEYYDVKQVHISGRGHWFKNAIVVATIIILQNKQKQSDWMTRFFIWKKSLEEIEKDVSIERSIINCSLLNKLTDESVITFSTYSPDEIDELRSLNISFNAFFYDIKW